VQIGIITLNKDGVIVVNNNIVVHYPSLPAVVKDPSGAGDVFAGAFLGHFIEHKDIDLACKVALKDASDAVATLGIAAYIPHAVKITSLREHAGWE
jgi:sugar/nucleoside kinase (ribokinase family)